MNKKYVGRHRRTNIKGVLAPGGLIDQYPVGNTDPDLRGRNVSEMKYKFKLLGIAAGTIMMLIAAIITVIAGIFIYR